MVGVLLGGGLTFLTHRTAQRAADRTRLSELVEARRAEQIRVLTEFIRFAHQAEGVAHARPPTWEVGDDWYRSARPAMDGLRVAEQSVELLCSRSLREPTARYERALNEAVWQDRHEAPLGEHLAPYKEGFLAAARESLADSAGR